MALFHKIWPFLRTKIATLVTLVIDISMTSHIRKTTTRNRRKSKNLRKAKDNNLQFIKIYEKQKTTIFKSWNGEKKTKFLEARLATLALKNPHFFWVFHKPQIFMFFHKNPYFFWVNPDFFLKVMTRPRSRPRSRWRLNPSPRTRLHVHAAS